MRNDERAEGNNENLVLQAISGELARIICASGTAPEYAVMAFFT